ncbi:MAG TPA: TonB-dependent receptor [Kiritimatiellia bacterium]|nr:TonB-dependent receptor [Kiritimatiellia bacterium]HPS09168.1 TonB-dependent receptor [Kiritimatiellia bacterium]
MKTTYLRTRTLVAGVALSFAATCASAQTDDARYQKLEDEVKALRQQVTTLQEQHTREMAELKDMLKQQAAAAAASPQPLGTPAATVAPPSLYDSLKQSAAVLVPQAQGVKGVDLDMSVVLDLYFYHDDTKEGMSHLRQGLSGFGHHHDDAEGHDHGGPENGFNLRHVELGFSAEVDPYFRAWTTVAVDEDGAEFEEAVLQTTSLPYGLTLSGGKIKSGIGRLNRQHSHNWDFFDAPLVYEQMFGAHGLAEKGLQLTWLAPTPFYLLFGTEVFNGENEHSFNVGDADALPAHDAPRLYTAFMKTGPDLGPNHALQFGLSALSGRHQMVHEDEECADGDTSILGTDFVYKYDAKRTHGEGDFVLQGEYFYRDMGLDGEGDWSGTPWTAKQDGYYVQGLYGFLPRWRGGLRWDQIGLINDLDTPEDGSVTYGDSSRLAAMLDWKLSEFSLLRAQAGRGWYDTEDGREDAWEFALQWQLTFGKHGAHDF